MERSWAGTVTSARKKSGKLRSFAALAGSVELFARHNSLSFSAYPSPPICCCCRSLLHRLIMLLLQMADVSCRISGKFSALFYVHFWLIISPFFVVFCFSIHWMRSSSSLQFIRCFLLCDGCLVLARSISFVFSLPFRLYKVFSSAVFMRVFMSL